MSGRENIYINASIFGLKKSEITERLDEIIKFSELEEFIDNPVRTYSSGMYMRLAFAVAINVNADILLIDEILAVGDVSFQKKCFDRLKEIRRQGTTIVIVSHDMTQLYNICDRLIWLEDGIIKDDGIPEKVGMKYLDSMEETRIARLAKESQDNFQSDDRLALLSLADNVHPDAHRFGTHEAKFTHIEVLDGRGKSARIFSTGDKLTLVIDFETSLEHPSVNFNMDLVNDSGQYCYGSCMAKAGDILPVLEANGTVIFEIDRLMLLPGKYFLDLGINGTDGELYDNLRNIIQISVRDYPHNEFGPCTFEHHWEMR
jgi:ABC-2 type transport system ATP-binding protein